MCFLLNWFCFCSLLAFLLVPRAEADVLSQSVGESEISYVDLHLDSISPGHPGYLSFLELVKQKERGNEIRQCPCVSLPGSGRCITYDSRFQAANIPEAIISFVDLSLDGRPLGEPEQAVIDHGWFNCQSKMCRNCAALLFYRLKRAGLVHKHEQFPFPLPDEATLTSGSCPRLRIGHRVPVPAPPRTVPYVAKMIKAGENEMVTHPLPPPSTELNQLIDQRITEDRGFVAGLTRGSGITGRSPTEFPAPVEAVPRQVPSEPTVEAPPQAPMPPVPAQQAEPPQQVTIPLPPPGQEPHQPPNWPPLPPPPLNGHISFTEIFQAPPQPPQSLLTPGAQSQPFELQLAGQSFQQPQAQFQAQQPLIDLSGQTIGNAPQLQGSTQPQFGGQEMGQGFAGQAQSSQVDLSGQTIGNAPQFQGAGQSGGGFQTVPNLGVSGSAQGGPDLSGSSQGGGFGQGGGFQGQGGGLGGAGQLLEAGAQGLQSGLSSIPGLQGGQGLFGGQGTQGGQGGFGGGAAGIGGGGGAGGVGGGLGGAQAGIGGLGGPAGIGSVGGQGGLGNLGSEGGLGGLGSSGGLGGIPGIGGGGPGRQDNPAGGGVLGAVSSGVGGGIGGGVGGGLGGLGRKKRQARRPETPTLGERFVISCVERGEPESEDTDYLNLCTACWTWRQLPADYFPRLVNELVCKENDFCLSGWGACQQRYRNLDVLKRVRNDWVPTTISIATCCDCRVKAGTEAHPLVTGNRK